MPFAFPRVQARTAQRNNRREGERLPGGSSHSRGRSASRPHEGGLSSCLSAGPECAVSRRSTPGTRRAPPFYPQLGGGRRGFKGGIIRFLALAAALCPLQASLERRVRRRASGGYKHETKGLWGGGSQSFTVKDNALAGPDPAPLSVRSARIQVGGGSSSKHRNRSDSQRCLQGQPELAPNEAAGFWLFSFLLWGRGVFCLFLVLIDRGRNFSKRSRNGFPPSRCRGGAWKVLAAPSPFVGAVLRC